MKSTRRQSISSRTTTAGCRSRRSCPAGSPTCWPTAPAASRSAWPPTCRRTTCGSWPRPSTGAWRTTRPTRKPPSRRSSSGSRARTSPPTGLIVGTQGIHDAYRTGRGFGPDARCRRDRRGHPRPHRHRHHRAAVSGQPRQLHHLDRRAGPRRQAGRHLQHRGPVQRPGRSAHRRRDQARRRGQGGAEQPLQAHPAADQLRRQHAVDRRRRAAHAAPRPDDPATTSTISSTSSSGAPPTGCARPTSGPTSCAVWSRRSTRSTR